MRTPRTTKGPWAAALIVARGACNGVEPTETEARQASAADGAPDASDVKELIADQAMDAISYSALGDACVVACAASYATLCLRTTTNCAAAAVITVGGSTVPCSTAIAAACIGGAALASICNRRCPP